LKALGDPVRLSVIRQLLKTPENERPCGTFDHSVSKATFSHHIKILREAGIIHIRHEGTRSMTSLRVKDLQKRFPGLHEMLIASK
jgi:DNA-binding transcriptional ArsR family regulator